MPRVFDIFISLIALVVLSPLLLIAAIAIKLGSRGPVLYRQRRVGLAGREFEMLKLRTMVLGSDPIGVGKVVERDDPRVTGAGRLLRRTSLDEIPNLVNVLRGEMAIVGPPPPHPRPGERLRPAAETPPRGAPRDHRLGPRSGPCRHPLGGADRARRRVRRSPQCDPRPPHPAEDDLAAHHRPRPRP